MWGLGPHLVWLRQITLDAAHGMIGLVSRSLSQQMPPTSKFKVVFWFWMNEVIALIVELSTQSLHENIRLAVFWKNKLLRIDDASFHIPCRHYYKRNSRSQGTMLQQEGICRFILRFTETCHMLGDGELQGDSMRFDQIRVWQITTTSVAPNAGHVVEFGSSMAKSVPSVIYMSRPLVWAIFLSSHH